MAMTSEFLAAVNQISSERGINPESVFKALEAAVLVAYKKDYMSDSEADNVVVELDRETGAFKVIAKKEVVKKVDDENTQISVAKAQKMDKSLKAGDTLEMELEIAEFGRIAAQTAKQVILQKIREFEKEAVLNEFSGKVGEIFTALMQRMQGGQVAVFEIGKASAFMKKEDQIPNEFYRIGERYKVLLKGIEETPRGQELVVSRSDPDFLKGLFKMEVPEIESGVVEIKACAREAGSRSKMAVVSHQDGVDPIGSCVGQRGVRIANVMSELGEEKIDVIEWNEDLSKFVENSLSPAKVLSVEITKGVAKVTVQEDQLSLAIGREGQNARLAAKLTGMKIDIQAPKSGEEVTPVADESDEVEVQADVMPSLDEVVDVKEEVTEVEEKPKKAIKKSTKTKKSETEDKKEAKPKKTVKKATKSTTDKVEKAEKKTTKKATKTTKAKAEKPAAKKTTKAKSSKKAE